MCSRHCDISGKRWSTQVRLALRIPLSGPAEVTVIGCFSAAATSRPLRVVVADQQLGIRKILVRRQDRKSTRLNSSHSQISYAVFCLKKKKKREPRGRLVVGGDHPPLR